MRSRQAVSNRATPQESLGKTRDMGASGLVNQSKISRGMRQRVFTISGNFFAGGRGSAQGNAGGTGRKLANHYRMTPRNTSLRQLLLLVVFIGVVGLQVELALLRHAESFTQWIPHIALFVGILSTLVVYFGPLHAPLYAFRLVMLAFLLVVLLGFILLL